MSASNPGPVRRFFRGVWRVVDVSRRVVLNLIFLLILTVVVLASCAAAAAAGREDGARAQSRRLDRRAARRQPALDRARPAARRDDAAEDAAARRARRARHRRQGRQDRQRRADPRRARRHRPGDAARDRRRGRPLQGHGKKVVAWGSSYDQRQYYIAAHADEVYLHPLGAVNVTGFGGVQNYYKDALDKVGVSVKVMRAGTFKDFGEPYTANGPRRRRARPKPRCSARSGRPTPTSREARKLAAGAVMKSIDEAPARLPAVGGDRGQAGAGRQAGRRPEDARRAARADDRARRRGRRAQDLPPGLVRRVPGAPVSRGSPATRSASSSPRARSSTAPPRSAPIGGLSTANLIRKARDDKDIKAIVLRVNSPGGSVFGSELVRRELELTRAAGKPVVVSMGDLAASGGYWISTASDEIIADPATVTGSIGVFALLPNRRQRSTSSASTRRRVATTWLRSASIRACRSIRAWPTDPGQRRPRVPRFTARAAQARKTTPDKIDAVAQGRVWSGAQALERGLVDRLGRYGDALSRPPSAPSSATTRDPLHRARAGERSRALSRCSMPKWRALFPPRSTRS